jgi:hypothetical protein
MHSKSSRPSFEQLEDRLVPASVIASDAAHLIADINVANLAGGSNTIALVANTTYTLAAADNTTDGATGLPVIAANDNLTIIGNSATIARSTVSGTPAFRLLDVAAGASLTLQHLTLQGGWAMGGDVAADGTPTFNADGGAIFNQGTLDLAGVTVQNNLAQGAPGVSVGGPGAAAAGGGIYSAGTLTLEDGTIVQNNQALGGQGVNGAPGGHVDHRSGSRLPPGDGGAGGAASGGGLAVAGGTATLTNATLSGNSATGGNGGAGGDGVKDKTYPYGGGNGGAGGNGLGGGLAVTAGTVTLVNDVISANTAQGGQGGTGGQGYFHPAGTNGAAGNGYGGAVSIDVAASLFLDTFTLGNVRKNHASSSSDNFFGAYSLLS